MALDMISFDAALKQHYTDERVQNMVYQDQPFLAMVPKYEKFGGRNLPIPVIFGNPQGRSATFSRAQTRGAVTNTRIDEFLITRVKDYSIATIDNETIEASKGDANAFLEAATTEIDGAIHVLKRSLGVKLYGTGFGGIGVLNGGSVAGTTLTLATVEDITNFEVGMELTAAAAETTGATRAYGSSGNGLIVTAVNRRTGVLTFGFAANDATNGIPTIGTTDVLFVRGDRQEGASPVAICISGLRAWVPTADPAATAFFGVDRTLDSTRLSGIRFDASAMPIEEGLIEGASLGAREGGTPDHFFMSFSKYADLEKALGSKVQYVDMKVGEIGFRGIAVNGPKGIIKCIPDVNCPNRYGFMLDMSTWKLYSLGKVPRVLDTDGLQMLRQASADGVEVRYGGYLQLGCRAPGYNTLIDLGV